MTLRKAVQANSIYESLIFGWECTQDLPPGSVKRSDHRDTILFYMWFLFPALLLITALVLLVAEFTRPEISTFLFWPLIISTVLSPTACLICLSLRVTLASTHREFIRDADKVLWALDSGRYGKLSFAELTDRVKYTLTDLCFRIKTTEAGIVDANASLDDRCDLAVLRSKCKASFESTYELFGKFQLVKEKRYYYDEASKKFTLQERNDLKIR